MIYSHDEDMFIVCMMRMCLINFLIFRETGLSAYFQSFDRIEVACFRLLSLGFANTVAQEIK